MGKQHIELSPRVLTFTDEAGERSYAVGQVARQLLGLPRPPNGILPAAVRWIGPGGRRWLLERPGRRLRVDDGTGESHEILLPFTLLLVDLDTNRFRCWCRPRQLSSLDDEIYHLPLPASYHDPGVTLPRVSADSAVDQILNAALAQFDSIAWGRYAADSATHPEALSGWDVGPELLLAWAALDAVSIMEAGWRSAGTLSEMLAQQAAPPATGSVFELLEQTAAGAAGR
jgi:hypothetical protein